MASHQATTHYARVKRGKFTAFVYIEPQDTIRTFKEKVLSLINTTPKHPQIFENPDAPHKTLEDIDLRFDKDVSMLNESTINDNGIDRVTGQVVYLLFKDDSGNWEAIDIHSPPPVGVPSDIISMIKEQQLAKKAAEEAAAKAKDY